MAGISKSIVHLSMRRGSLELAIGTGFIYKKDEKFYIVTAWHNVTGRHPDTFELNSKAAIPDNVIINFCVEIVGGGMVRMAISLPLHDSDKSLFYIHKENWPRIDVVAIPFDPYIPHDILGRAGSGENIHFPFPLINNPEVGMSTKIAPIQDFVLERESVVAEWFEFVDVTEELFIPGYPQNVQDMYIQPVWKRATIASSVQMGWNNQKKFLVDSASKKGMSGSPVLYHSSQGRISINGTTTFFGREASILAGVYVGREGVRQDQDPQIGIVWHSDVIDEIIDGQRHENHPDFIGVLPIDLRGAIESALSKCSQEGLDNVNNPERTSRYYLRNKVMMSVEGRACPDHVLEKILEIAANYDGPLVPSENN